MVWIALSGLRMGWGRFPRTLSWAGLSRTFGAGERNWLASLREGEGFFEVETEERRER